MKVCALLYFVVVWHSSLLPGSYRVTSLEQGQSHEYLDASETTLTNWVNTPDSKVHGANMGPIWGRQDPGGPHVGPMNFAIWDSI